VRGSLVVGCMVGGFSTPHLYNNFLWLSERGWQHAIAFRAALHCVRMGAADQSLANYGKAVFGVCFSGWVDYFSVRLQLCSI
jgi:hypothetical protein